MIRTKELVVFLACTGFLLMAILVTVLRDGGGPVLSGQSAAVSLPTVPAVELAVAIHEESSVDKPSLRAQMRDKIVAYRAAGGTERNQFVVRDGDPQEATVAAVAVAAGAGVQRCTDYAVFAGTWPASVQLDEREGARIVYTRPAGQSDPTATSVVGLYDDVLVQLSVHTQPQLQQYCIQSDVIGVAQDGSLIRNQEVELYSVFTDSTIVGYALDGYPIYGQNDVVDVDQCGGATVAGQYGYVLQSDRPVVVNCFRGVPAQL